MSNKQFSCVEMKRTAAEKIHNETHLMTLSEKLQYWKRGEAKLRQMINGSKKSNNHQYLTPLSRQ